jgi:hypothetical protein
MKEISIVFGAVAPRLSDQLESQGCKFKNADDLLKFQKMVDSITFLVVQGVVSLREKQDIHKRILKQLSKAVDES